MNFSKEIAAESASQNSARPIVVGLGEVLWDVFPSGKKLGGAPANFSYHASRQGCRGIVVSALGNDVLGDEIENLLAAKNLEFFLPRVPAPTGTVSVSVDENGVAHYVFAENSAWDFIPFSEEIAALARRVSAVCFGTLAQRNPRSRETVRRFLDCVPADALRVFDVNFRQNFFTREIVLDSLARCSILKINADELPLVADFVGAGTRSRKAFSAALFEKFPQLKIVVTTLGGDGSAVDSRDGTTSFVPAEKCIEIADTVGAGDSFTAGFVCALLAGVGVSEAHRRASALANFVCSRAGAMPEIPAALRFRG